MLTSGRDYTISLLSGCGGAKRWLVVGGLADGPQGQLPIKQVIDKSQKPDRGKGCRSYHWGEMIQWLCGDNVGSFPHTMIRSATFPFLISEDSARASKNTPILSGNVRYEHWEDQSWPKV